MKLVIERWREFKFSLRDLGFDINEERFNNIIMYRR
jgi:hypothetical protein